MLKEGEREGPCFFYAGVPGSAAARRRMWKWFFALAGSRIWCYHSLRASVQWLCAALFEKNLFMTSAMTRVDVTGWPHSIRCADARGEAASIGRWYITALEFLAILNVKF